MSKLSDHAVYRDIDYQLDLGIELIESRHVPVGKPDPNHWTFHGFGKGRRPIVTRELIPQVHVMTDPISGRKRMLAHPSVAAMVAQLIAAKVRSRVERAEWEAFTGTRAP